MSELIPTPVSFTTGSNASFTVSNTAIVLSTKLALDGNSANLQNCNVFSVTVTGNDVRMFENGNIPTASLGHLLKADTNTKIYSAPSLIRFIRATGSDGTVTITPFKS